MRIDVRCQMSEREHCRHASTDIRHLTSDICPWRNYADTDSRLALRRANIDEETRLHAYRRIHACAWHRREHGHLHNCQRGVIAPAALSRIGKIGSYWARFQQ